jgi:hypothetical protein
VSVERHLVLVKAGRLREFSIEALGPTPGRPTPLVGLRIRTETCLELVNFGFDGPDHVDQCAPVRETGYFPAKAVETGFDTFGSGVNVR